MDWPLSLFASSLWSGMTLTTGNRSGCFVTFLTVRFSCSLRVRSRSLGAWRFNGLERREPALRARRDLYLCFAIKAQRTGVGIAGMREHVRHFKGELDIQSKGTGATIVVTFPLATAVASGSEAILQPSEAAYEAA
jgi:hypothetical protein